MSIMPCTLEISTKSSLFKKKQLELNNRLNQYKEGIKKVLDYNHEDLILF